jgi:hypothetical protein
MKTVEVSGCVGSRSHSCVIFCSVYYSLYLDKRFQITQQDECGCKKSIIFFFLSSRVRERRKEVKEIRVKVIVQLDPTRAFCQKKKIEGEHFV